MLISALYKILSLFNSCSKTTKIIIINVAIVLAAIGFFLLFFLGRKEDGAATIVETVNSGIRGLVTKKEEVIKEHERKAKELEKEREKKVAEIKKAKDSELDKIIKDKNL